MLKYGFDIDFSGDAVCAVKQWEEKNITTAYLLFSYGTEIAPLSICPNARDQCMEKMEGMIRQQLDLITYSGGVKDTQYVLTKLNDVLRQCNLETYQIGAFLGQGIYLGGTVIFIQDVNFLVIPFGGGMAYLWDGDKLLLKCDPPNPNGLISDALGSCEKWRGKYWTGTLSQGNQLFCTTHEIQDLDQAVQNIVNGNNAESHRNTTAMLIRRQLETADFPPTAVLHIG